MEKLSRRTFTRNILGSLLTFSLARNLCRADALGGSVKPVVHKWLVEMEDVTKGLRGAKIKPSEWQTQIEALLSRVELKDLLAAIDYEHLARTAIFPEDHESAENVDFSQVEGLPKELSFAPYFYAMKRGVAIVPHGHRNMASMHMMLKGEAHGWLFERVADETQHLLIKPTEDKVLGVGEVSTISDEKDNIHWFKALTEPVFMFNIGVFGIKASEGFTGRDYVDPLGGEKLKDGLIRARRLEVKEAYKIYGKS
ncbi:MAG TPA: hypothetical protein VF666_04350 [Pyrinomonadaceae bacterium]|jgi:hypothetical protein